MKAIPHQYRTIEISRVTKNYICFNAAEISYNLCCLSKLDIRRGEGIPSLLLPSCFHSLKQNKAIRPITHSTFI